jgi:hypothetical protein
VENKKMRNHPSIKEDEYHLTSLWYRKLNGILIFCKLRNIEIEEMGI